MINLSNIAKQYADQGDALREKYGPDFDKPSRTQFGLTVAEHAIVEEWLQTLVPEIVEKQRQNGISRSITGDQPYYGAVGGGVTYSFVPTSLGTIIIAKESTTGKELNVSDAAGWYFYG